MQKKKKIKIFLQLCSYLLDGLDLQSVWLGAEPSLWPIERHKHFADNWLSFPSHSQKESIIKIPFLQMGHLSHSGPQGVQMMPQSTTKVRHTEGNRTQVS